MHETTLERRGLDAPYTLRDGREVYYSTVHNSWAIRWEEAGEPLSTNISETEAKWYLLQDEQDATVEEAIINVQTAIGRIYRVWEYTESEELSDALAELEQALRWLRGQEEVS